MVLRNMLLNKFSKYLPTYTIGWVGIGFGSKIHKSDPNKDVVYVVIIVFCSILLLAAPYDFTCVLMNTSANDADEKWSKIMLPSSYLHTFYQNSKINWLNNKHPII